MAHEPEKIAIRRDFHGTPQVFLLSKDEDFRLVLPTGDSGFKTLDEAALFAAQALDSELALWVCYALERLESGTADNIDEVFECAREVVAKHRQLRHDLRDILGLKNIP